MSTSDKFGGLSWLSFIWNHGPLFAAAFLFLIDFGVIYVLMRFEGKPLGDRQRYMTFMLNDTLFFPVYAAVATYVLHRAEPSHAWYTKPAWHWSVLIVGFVISGLMELIAVQTGEFTLNQEHSPSKLWHTFIFGVVFYWLISSMVPVWASHKPWPSMVVVVLCTIGSVAMILNDMASPKPRDAHLEGTYLPWKWHERSNFRGAKVKFMSR